MRAHIISVSFVNIFDGIVSAQNLLVDRLTNNLNCITIIIITGTREQPYLDRKSTAKFASCEQFYRRWMSEMPIGLNYVQEFLLISGIATVHSPLTHIIFIIPNFVFKIEK